MRQTLQLHTKALGAYDKALDDALENGYDATEKRKQRKPRK